MILPIRLRFKVKRFKVQRSGFSTVERFTVQRCRWPPKVANLIGKETNEHRTSNVE
jgi:hypothetical protein